MMELNLTPQGGGVCPITIRLKGTNTFAFPLNRAEVKMNEIQSTGQNTPRYHETAAAATAIRFDQALKDGITSGMTRQQAVFYAAKKSGLIK